MKRYTIDVTDEQHILVNMISNTSYLRSISYFVQSRYFETPFARVLSKWILEYFDKLDKAPVKDIQDLYRRKKHEVQDEDDLQLLGDFIAGLNEYYKKCEINNLEYEVQKAEQYFKLRALEDLSDKLDNAVDTSNPAQGEKAVADFKRVEKPTGEGVSLFEDSYLVQQAFDFTEEQMYKMPGKLGDVLGYFTRGDFVAVLAPVKCGKSFYLWDIARYGALQGFNVVFFSLEMSQNQMVRRAWQSFVGQPYKAKTLDIPVFNKDSDEYVIETERRDFKGMDLSEVEQKQQFYRMKTRGNIHIQTYSSGHATMETLETHLANLEYFDNFIPDVVVVDYADIIKSSGRDYRHNLNDIWVRLRGWAQEKHCLVVTASQTSKQAFTRDSKIGDVAEDMRKLAHVTKLFSLNQTKEEREVGVMRIEPLLAREGKSTFKQVVVLESRDIGRIYLDAQLRDDVFDYRKGERFGGEF